MKRLPELFLCGALAAAGLAALSSCANARHASALPPPVGTPVDPGAAVRIGTFDSRGVALAYGRSKRPDCMLADVMRIRAEHDAAKASGDVKRATRLEGEAVALQAKIHAQVFAGAPIDDVLALLNDDLPGIAERQNVDVIVSGVLHRRPGVEFVDITRAMCEPFEPDDETNARITELLGHPPVPIDQLDHGHDHGH